MMYSRPHLNSDKQKKLLGGVLIAIASGLPWWLTDYHTYSLSSYYTYLSIGGCMLGALLLSLFTSLSFKDKLVTAIASHMAAFVIKLVLDLMEDKTNHNLFPFEMAFYLVIDLVGCSILIYAGAYLRKMIVRS